MELASIAHFILSLCGTESPAVGRCVGKAVSCTALRSRGSSGERPRITAAGVRDLWLLVVIGLKIASEEWLRAQIDGALTQLPAFIPLARLQNFQVSGSERV
jgi:hypothetical protein